MKQKLQPVEHFLITIDLCPAPYRLHSYVMTNDKRCLEGIWDKMFHELDKRGIEVMLPMVLQTKLGNTAESAAEVRGIVGKENQKAKKLFEAATDFHVSIFMLPSESPDDKILMDLH